MLGLPGAPVARGRPGPTPRPVRRDPPAPIARPPRADSARAQLGGSRAVVASSPRTAAMTPRSGRGRCREPPRPGARTARPGAPRPGRPPPRSRARARPGCSHSRGGGRRSADPKDVHRRAVGVTARDGVPASRPRATDSLSTSVNSRRPTCRGSSNVGEAAGRARRRRGRRTGPRRRRGPRSASTSPTITRTAPSGR